MVVAVEMWRATSVYSIPAHAQSLLSSDIVQYKQITTENMLPVVNFPRGKSRILQTLVKKKSK